ncbi:peptidase domain-containing ABC transporter [Pseudoflavitalea sp. G-6-1-2]|uniref:peptidase domain-containing ABC transporter n=1 Tax=Pseudoflavitalea sp. G-6-1-2 TaxID=2728841 RepID=UPI00146C3CDA|nr:peptidase domain-containing ABC transporter [Pseudoflavitalea sp. G-6-1-2]NML20658.1 peptidase domain-containing ABC transporter [Pseudoflavitalea sp. G-6-1-2]
MHLKKNTKVKQHDITDCGAACLQSIAAHYNLQLPIAQIRQMAGTDTKGTNILGLVEAAQKLGFEAKGVKGTYEAMLNMPVPAIAHVIVQQRIVHYVVIYKVTAEEVTVMDPIDGQAHTYKAEDFKKMWTGVLVLLLPAETFKEGNEKISHLQRFWHLLRPHKAVSLQVLFGAAVYTILGLATSLYVQNIVDHVLIGGNTRLLNLMGVTMIVILLLQFFIGSLKNIFALKTSQHLDASLILGYYKHLLKLPQTFFDTMRVGEITSRITDAVKIRLFINDTAMGLLVNAFIVIFSFVVMFIYQWKLAFLVMAVIPIYLLMYYVSNKFNKKWQRKMMEDSAELGSQLVESLNTITTIKRFGLEEHANLKTESRFIKLLKSIFYTGTFNVHLGNAASFVNGVLVVALLWTGAYMVVGRNLSAGELLSFYALVGYFTGPAMSIIGANKSMQDALIAADRLFEIMDLEQEDTGNKIKLEAGKTGDINFHQVSFRYGTRVDVFKSLDLEIPQQSITAIVGESGSGKSTMIALLQNLYPLKSGHITIGDTDIRYFDNESLRQRVSVVPQQIDLFAGSVLENIAVGEFEPDMQRVIDISRQLGILEFVEQLPGGFNTWLGEHGVNLSGGQRQRLAIARALYRDPDILIMDEATSSLDPIADQMVQLVMQRLRRNGKTIIVIAHRLSTVMNADKIVVLKNGQLQGQGSHAQLLKNNSTYAELWSHHQGTMLHQD